MVHRCNPIVLEACSITAMLDDPDFVGEPIFPHGAAFITEGDLHHGSTTLLVNIIHSVKVQDL
jgi:hypothetical protein